MMPDDEAYDSLDDAPLGDAFESRLRSARLTPAAADGLQTMYRAGWGAALAVRDRAGMERRRSKLRVFFAGAATGGGIAAAILVIAMGAHRDGIGTIEPIDRMAHHPSMAPLRPDGEPNVGNVAFDDGSPTRAPSAHVADSRASASAAAPAADEDPWRRPAAAAEGDATWTLVLSPVARRQWREGISRAVSHAAEPSPTPETPTPPRGPLTPRGPLGQLYDELF